ncbi:MAG: hypothetical protein JXR69_01780, partial [Candidatus Delongbacteria bacterium]|nr:hypothetical protein [Candidatus Delongbacteria bacterium]
MTLLERKERKSYSEEEHLKQINQFVKIENFINEKLLFSKIFDIDNPDHYVWKLGAMGKLIKNNLIASWKNTTVLSLNNIYGMDKITNTDVLDKFSELFRSKKMEIPFGINRISNVNVEQFESAEFTFHSGDSNHINMDYFVVPSTSEAMLKTWNDFVIDFFYKIGFNDENIVTEFQNIVDHPSTDDYFFDRYITKFKFPFGEETVFTISDRIDFYFENSERSFSEEEINSLRIKDTLRNEKLLPHMLSINIDVDKLILALIFNGYRELQVRNAIIPTVIFSPQIAPVKCCVFPLSSVDRNVRMRSEKIHTDLNNEFKTLLDEKGTLEIRSMKYKEIGVPYFVTVDPELL